MAGLGERKQISRLEGCALLTTLATSSIAPYSSDNNHDTILQLRALLRCAGRESVFTVSPLDTSHNALRSRRPPI